MPKVARLMTALAVKRLSRRPGRWPVGGTPGLYLRVTDSGSAQWVYRVVVGGRRRDIGLGAYQLVSLEHARDEARRMYQQIRAGVDPTQARAQARAELRTAQLKTKTFAQCAREAHAAKAPEFKNKKHSAQWLSTLETYAVPIIGSKPIGDIDTDDVLKCLQPIWLTKTETATRVRQRIEQVLAWAAVMKLRPKANPAAWRHNLDKLLPKPAKVKKVEHYPALPYKRMPEFTQALREQKGMSARALEFAIYTAARSGEVRLATWAEIDLKRKLWTVPAARMKAGLAHRVPLTDTAIQLLEAARIKGSNYVFPAPRGGPLSDMSISAVCRRMHEGSVEAGHDGYLDPTSNRPVVPHGMRSSFKDWSRNEHPTVQDEVSELCLAHVSDDKTRAAYARDELLPLRTKLMQQWAEFLSGANQHG